jgi:hypothetical protein
MQKFLMIYCQYNPGFYTGHKVRHITAESFDAAEGEAHKFLNRLAGKGKWEYRIFLTSDETGYRVFNTLTQEKA